MPTLPTQLLLAWILPTPMWLQVKTFQVFATEKPGKSLVTRVLLRCWHRWASHGKARQARKPTRKIINWYWTVVLSKNICIKRMSQTSDYCIVISSDWAISSRSEKVQAWCRSGTHLGLSAIVVLWQDVQEWQKVFNIKCQKKLHISSCSIIEEITSALVNPKILQFKGIKFSHSKSPK